MTTIEETNKQSFWNEVFEKTQTVYDIPEKFQTREMWNIMKKLDYSKIFKKNPKQVKYTMNIFRDTLHENNIYKISLITKIFKIFSKN